MSGRGLGHTGGTLDKLESIPGFRVELSIDEFVAQVREVGLAIVGQTADLVPADKKLYALRDVTATVDEVSLIAASIMSKKIAGGADAIVLDVKVGDGAFMKTLDDARALARGDARARAARGPRGRLPADRHGPAARPRGRQRARDPRGARDVRGEGPPDFTELVLDACARLLALSDLGVDEDEGRRRAEAAVADGSALGRLRALDPAQGGDPDRGGAPARAGRPRGARAAATASCRGSARSPSASPRCTSAPGGGRRTTRSTTRSASSAAQARRRASPPATCLAEVHARDEAVRRRRLPSTEVLAAYELGDEPPPARAPASCSRRSPRYADARAARGRDGPHAARARASSAGRFERVEIVDPRLTRPARSGRGRGRARRASASRRSSGAASTWSSASRAVALSSSTCG